jgi:hypothetical protein
MESLGIVLSVMLAVMAVFQLLLALGRPYGKMAWGGQHEGVLPQKYRVGSIFSFALYVFLITVVLSRTGVINLYSESFENMFMWISTVIFGLNIPMNAVSKSKPERLWAPYAAVMFIISLIIVL